MMDFPYKLHEGICVKLFFFTNSMRLPQTQMNSLTVIKIRINTW
jgi:hypothetical protein